MDSKRRISIPTKNRKELGKSVVVTRGFDGFLNVYPSSLWTSGQTKAQKLNRKLSINDKHRKLSRFLTSGDQVDVDSSGRMVIPEHLVKFSALDETIVFVGTEEGFQIWGSDRWDKEGMPSMDEVKELAESEEFQKLTDSSD